jgi:hypothetical protein
MRTRGRFILRYTGTGPAPDAHVTRLCTIPGTKVLDATNRMLLIEGPAPKLQAATRGLDDWVLTADKSIPVPDTRKKIRRRAA